MKYNLAMSTSQYGVVFDAGSSHTTVYLYRWPGNERLGGTAVPVDEIYRSSHQPGRCVWFYMDMWWWCREGEGKQIPLIYIKAPQSIFYGSFESTLLGFKIFIISKRIYQKKADMFRQQVATEVKSKLGQTKPLWMHPCPKNIMAFHDINFLLHVCGPNHFKVFQVVQTIYFIYFLCCLSYNVVYLISSCCITSCCLSYNRILTIWCEYLWSSLGISSFVNNPELAGNSIANLIKKVSKNVPANKRSSTPIYVGATAGMRLVKYVEVFVVKIANIIWWTAKIIT